MTFVARIADIDLVVEADPAPGFGSVLDSDGRSIALTAIIEGISKDNCAAQVSVLNERLSEPCDLVMTPTGSACSQALRLKGGGAATITNAQLFEIGNVAIVSITAPCAPYAVPANRVYLANPFGDEWPSALVTDVSRSSANYVFADGGRWRVRADATADGTMNLYGDAIPDEVLVVEFDYEVTAASSGGNVFYVVIGLRSTDGGANISAWTMLLTASVGSGHVRELVRVPDSAARFCLTTVADYVTGNVDGYIWNVQVGRKRLAAPRLVPGKASTTSGYVGIPYGWIATTDAGVTWTSSAANLRLEAANSVGAAFCSSVVDGDLNGAVPVVPGRRIGVRFTSQLTDYTDGTFRVALMYRDAANGSAVATVLREVTAADGAAVTTYWDGVVPGNAAKAYLYWGVTAANATGNFNITDVEIGEHVVESPGAIALSAVEGEHPAAVEVYGDVDIESDAHSVYLGVGMNDGPYLWEAEALPWTGGAYSTNATSYPGTGNTGWYCGGATGATRRTATIDTSRVKRGAYLLLVRGQTTSASYDAVFDCDESDGAAVATRLTTPAWYSLGQIVLPARRTHTGTAANITVGMQASASNYGVVDRYLLVPLTQGGHAYYHDATAGDAISQFDVLGDGTILLDSAVDMTDCGGGQLLATSRDRLVVCAEEAASDETTHLAILDLLHTPLYDLWRGA